MKKTLSILAVMMITLTAMAQKDTGRIHDTVYVYVFNITDTIPCQYMYEGKKKRVYKEKGFVLAQGYKINNDKGLVWAEQPRNVGVLDEKKKPVKNVIQILN